MDFSLKSCERFSDLSLHTDTDMAAIASIPLVLLALIPFSLAQDCGLRTEAQCAGDCTWDVSFCTKICFRSQTAYTPDMNGQPITTASSREACQNRCESISGCEHYTYYSGSGFCHVHDQFASREGSSGAIAGEPFCSQVGTVTGPTAVNTPSTASTGSTGSTGGTGSTGSTFSNTGSAFGSSADPFAQGNAESMPPSLGSAIAVGRVSAGNSFSGLSDAEASPQLPQAAQAWGASAAVASCAAVLLVLLVAFAALQVGRRSRGEVVANAAE